MLNVLTRCAAALVYLVVPLAIPLALPTASRAEPVKLKLAYFTSDRTSTYQSGIKPFIDAVNAAGLGSVVIEPHVSGALGKDPATQLQLLLDGTADIAFVVPWLTPERFPGLSVIELPGLFRDGREATLVHAQLVADKRLKAYDDFHVISAYATDPETIHTRPKVDSLDDLSGLRIRANNPILAAALEKLGMKAMPMPVNKAAGAISAGVIDGAAVPPNVLFQFGVGRVASYHYLLKTSVAPLALLMTRKKLEALPKKAQEVILEFSGPRSVERYSESMSAENRRLLDQLRNDPKRTVIVPSARDQKTATAAFDAITRDWETQTENNKALLEAARAEIRKLRQAE